MSKFTPRGVDESDFQASYEYAGSPRRVMSVQFIHNKTISDRNKDLPGKGSAALGS